MTLCGIRRRRKRTENPCVGGSPPWRAAPHHEATLGIRVVFCFMYTVYILYSEKFNKHYSGFTSNMERRLKEHNLIASSGYSIRFRPWIILHTETFLSKKEAMKRESYFKTGVGRKFIQQLIFEKYPGIRNS